MGIRDFFRQRREAREFRRIEEARIRDEEAAERQRARQRRLEARVRKREAAERLRQSQRAQRKQQRRERRAEIERNRELRKKVAYERLHFWVESRIGIMEDLEDEEIQSRLQALLTEERQRNTAPRLHGNRNYDPFAGLEAYIRTNSYRRMLSGHAVHDEMIVEGGVQGAMDPDGPVGEKEEKNDSLDNGGTSYAGSGAHPEYERLQCWIEERIGPLKDLDNDEVHRKMLELLDTEKERNPAMRLPDGRLSDPTKGLAAYIRSRAYLKVLGK